MTTMNQRMARVLVGLLLVFVGLIVMLTWWQILAAGDLRQKASNNQTLYYEQRIQRGMIRSADGVILATNASRRGKNGDVIFSRRYPKGALASHVVGYNSRGNSRTGVERSLNDYLTGSTRDIGALLSKFDGDDQVVGDNVTLTINAKAQAIAQSALQGKAGSVVAIEPATGAVRVMASSPTFNLAKVDSNFAAIQRQPGSPLLNRATQARYAPGSTFKLVTAAAALADGMTPDTPFPGGCKVDVKAGPPVSNYFGECVGPHNLTYALTNSINTTFARIGDKLGQTKLRKQMEAFGFYSTPPLRDLPASEVRTSGLYGSDGKPLSPDEGVDAARLAIGQERLEVTPLQMAMVGAAIANKGNLMEPFVVEKVTSPGGRTIRRTKPKTWREAISIATARELTKMMQKVVTEGTGTAAALQGIDVAGKSGTADTSNGIQVWFVAFAPAKNPQIAIAVTIENQPSGATGGVVSAPIARDVMKALLKSRQ